MSMLNVSRRAVRIGAILMLPLLAAPVLGPQAAVAQVSVGISVNIAPPILPVIVQPPLPSPGYIWTPGYWAWDAVGADYYWVPGAWVAPPRVGLLWTPGYWGWVNGAYLFHGGYWGPTVGFYGGINYGFGYTGSGFYGGQWRGGQYFYNSSVNNVRNVNVTNVYNKTVIVNNNAPAASVNGGPNGTAAKPTPTQVAVAQAPHVAPTAAQVQHASTAKADPQAHFSTNQGKPQNAAVEKPLGPAPKGAEAPGGEPKNAAHEATTPGERPAAHNADKPAERAGKRNAESPAERPAAHKAEAPEERPAAERRPTERPAVERPAAERRPAERPAVERPAMDRPAPPRAAMMRRPPPPRMAPRPAPRPAPGCRGPQCR